MKQDDYSELTRINPHLKIEKFFVGQDPVYLIDDFYQNPLDLREFALKSDYELYPGAFPGFFSKVKISFEHVFDFFEKHLDYAPMFMTIRNTFLVITEHEKTFEKFQHLPHFDEPTPKLMSTLCYLNLPKQCSGGTAFYKHVPSDLEAVDHASDQFWNKLNQWGCYTIRDFKNKVRKEGKKYERVWTKDFDDQWELLSKVDMKFNRMLIFNANRFHGLYIHEGDFGKDLETGRLTHLMRFVTV